MVRTTSAWLRSRSTTISSGSMPANAPSTVAALTPAASAWSFSRAMNSEKSGRVSSTGGAGTATCPPSPGPRWASAAGAALNSSAISASLERIPGRAIHRDGLTGDVAACCRRQKYDKVRQLLGTAEAPERNTRHRRLAYIFDRFAALLRIRLIQLGDAFGVDPARRDHVDENSLRRELARQAFSQCPTRRRAARSTAPGSESAA